MAFVNSYNETSVRTRLLREGLLRKRLREQWLYDETLRGAGGRHHDARRARGPGSARAPSPPQAAEKRGDKIDGLSGRGRG